MIKMLFQRGKQLCCLKYFLSPQSFNYFKEVMMNIFKAKKAYKTKEMCKFLKVMDLSYLK